MYIEDLTEFGYKFETGWIDGPYAVGWLEKGKPFTTGDVPDGFYERLVKLSEEPVVIEMGLHECEWCDQSGPYAATGYFCIQGPDLKWYVAPCMIGHYVQSHGYLPPQSFIDAVLDTRAEVSEWSKASPHDIELIQNWLGRKPQAIEKINVRYATGEPVVIQNEPFREIGKITAPFPTLYWLVCPKLSAQISDIERRGGVREIEKILVNDDSLLQSHLQDNQLYAKTREAQLAYFEKEFMEGQGFEDILIKSGIAGVANHASVKCLHAQYAYHLAKYDTGTTVGRLMEEHFDIRFKP